MVRAKQLANTLLRTTKDKGDSVEEQVSVFVDYLTSRGLEEMLPAVLDSLKRQAKQKQLSEKIEVEVAYDMEGKESQLRELLQEESERPIEFKSNDELIGGFVVRTHEKEYDASLQEKLKRLSYTLKAN